MEPFTQATFCSEMNTNYSTLLKNGPLFFFVLTYCSLFLAGLFPSFIDLKNLI